MRYTIRPLDASTWAAFAELAERNNGVFGGCWCMGYHLEGPEKRMGISHRAAGREAQGRFLFSATVELFEDNGFTRIRQVGKHAWIVSTVVQAKGGD